MTKWTLLLLTGMLFFGMNPVFPEAEDAAYTIDMTVGTVELSRDGGKRWTRVELDQVMNEKDLVRTGRDSVCEIGMPGDQGTFRMEQNTEMEMGKLGKEIRIKVKSGISFFDIFKPLAKDELMNVETETAVIAVRGTQFFVEKTADEGTVSVAEGTVTVSRNIPMDIDRELDSDFRDAVETRATAGQEISYSRAENSDFMKRLKSLRGDREEIRKFLREQKREHVKKIRSFRDKKRFESVMKNHRADLDKIKQRKKQFLRNHPQIQKKNIDQKRKSKIKKAVINRKKVIDNIRNRQ